MHFTNFILLLLCHLSFQFIPSLWVNDTSIAKESGINVEIVKKRFCINVSYNHWLNLKIF
jgi:hypothetical protein